MEKQTSFLCWHCKEGTYEPDPDPRWKGWLVCGNCGATYNPHPSKLQPKAFDKKRNPVTGDLDITPKVKSTRRRK